MSPRTALLAAALLASGCTAFTHEKRIRRPVTAGFGVTDPAFRTSASNLLRGPLQRGNRVVQLLNGDRIFPAMVEAIARAERSVTLESYIWSSGEVSDRFIAALSERARAGVKVHVLVDAVGSIGLKPGDARKLRDAGVELERYNNPMSRHFFRANYRTHRKILVVDGRVGFTGGVCISDDWRGDAQPPFWRETHVRVEGPVVGQMQAVFADNWLQERSEVLSGTDYFPPLPEAGGMEAQFVMSGPRDGAENTRLAFLLSIAAARKHIRIANAYFAPDTLMIDTLLDARRRGVRVEVIVPGKIDLEVVRKASRPRWIKLLEAGVEFYEYTPTLYHPKVLIVDDVWSIVGSVNFDERSLRLNDEANLNVLDSGFAADLVASFEKDKAASRPLTRKDLDRRGFLNRLLDHAAGLFRSQL